MHRLPKDPDTGLDLAVNEKRSDRSCDVVLAQNRSTGAENARGAQRHVLVTQPAQHHPPYESSYAVQPICPPTAISITSQAPAAKSGSARTIPGLRANRRTPTTTRVSQNPIRRSTPRAALQGRP